MSKQKVLNQIALESFGLASLETANGTSFDLKTLLIRELAAALSAAYDAGKAAAGVESSKVTPLAIGQRVRCDPLGEDGHIVAYEADGDILIIDFVAGGTEHVPTGDCRAV